MRILKVKQAEIALRDGRLDEAFELVSDPWIWAHRRGQELVGRLVRALVERGNEHLSAGRVRQGLADCEKAERLGGNLVGVGELRTGLLRLARDQQQAGEAARAVRVAPPGLPPPAEAPAPMAIQSLRPGPVPEASVVDSLPGAEDGLPLRMLLQVDGAGSYLVLRASRVTFGPVSSSERPDVGLVAAASTPSITIERAEGDYFVQSAQPVSVNDRPVRRALLADGDRIALSPRCRLRFRLPHPASATAVIELAGTHLPTGDARRVVLLDREIILRPRPPAHVVAEGLAGEAVLYLQGGRWLWRTGLEVTANRRAVDLAGGIPLDVPVRIGGVGLVLSGA